MSDTGVDEGDLPEIVAWFAMRGFGITFETDNDVTWVHLRRPPNGAVVAPRYGRGQHALASAVSAKKRFKQEQ